MYCMTICLKVIYVQVTSVCNIIFKSEKIKISKGVESHREVFRRSFPGRGSNGEISRAEALIILKDSHKDKMSHTKC